MKLDGGFMIEVTEMEKKLMEQHMKSSVMTETQVNPYKRKKFPSSTIWHQAMNTLSSDPKGIEPPQYIEKCPCGSDNVIREGNRIHQRSEGAKVEIWGTKQDNDGVDRYRCLACGSSWSKCE